MLAISIILSPIGSLSEIWYLKDYWKPDTILSSSTAIEDFMFTFSLCGISFAIYKVAFGYKFAEERKHKRRLWLPIIFLAVVINGLTIFSSYLGYNSVVVSSILFVFISIYIWYMRTDLIFPSLVSGLLLLAVFIVIYKIMDFLYPNLITQWCLNCNPSGLFIYGINIEELAWDFTWGMVGGVIYEVVSGKELLLKNIGDVNNKSLDSFENFDNARNNFHETIDAVFFQSTKRILLIRAVRVLTYSLSKRIGRPLPDHYGIIIIAGIPFIVDAPLSVVDMHTSGIAMFWVIYYVTLSCLLFVFSTIAWKYFVHTWEQLSSIIESESEVEHIKLWMNRRLSLSMQIGLSLIAGTTSVYVLYLLSPLFAGHVNFGVASYIQVFINSFFGMAVVYWLWHVPLFVRELHKLDSINLLWYSPVDTDVIQRMTNLLAKSSVYALIGMVLTVFPPLYYIDKLASPGIVITTGLVFFFSGATVIFISIFPQYWIIEIVTNSKDRVLQKLSLVIPSDISPEKITDPLINQKILLYHQIKNSHISILDHKIIINYIISVLLAFFPYLLSIGRKIASYF